MAATPPVASTKRQAPSTLGPIDPAAKFIPRSASTVVLPMAQARACRSRVAHWPHPSAARGRQPASERREGGGEVFVDDRIHASEVPSSPRTTGTPPPPAQITVRPVSSNDRISSSSMIAVGSGDATTRRQLVPSSRIAQPCRR